MQVVEKERKIERKKERKKEREMKKKEEKWKMEMKKSRFEGWKPGTMKIIFMTQLEYWILQNQDWN